MAAFDVTPEELIQSGQQLKAIAQDLQSAHHRVESLRSAQLGSHRIDSALNHFADHWQHGMRRLVERVDMTGEALLAAGKQYADVDSGIAFAVDQM